MHQNQKSIILLLTVRYFRRTLIQSARQAFLQMLNFQTGRRYWMIQYNQLWFETMWDTREDDVTKELWKKEFRVSVFIRSNWRKFTAPRHPFSESYQVEKRLAIVIWRLSTGNTYRSVKFLVSENLPLSKYSRME